MIWGAIFSRLRDGLVHASVIVAIMALSCVAMTAGAWPVAVLAGAAAGFLAMFMREEGQRLVEWRMRRIEPPSVWQRWTDTLKRSWRDLLDGVLAGALLPVFV